MAHDWFFNNVLHDDLSHGLSVILGKRSTHSFITFKLRLNLRHKKWLFNVPETLGNFIIPGESVRQFSDCDEIVALEEGHSGKHCPEKCPLDDGPVVLGDLLVLEKRNIELHFLRETQLRDPPEENYVQLNRLVCCNTI